MPTLEQVNVVGSKENWRSPDGQRTIYEVDLIFRGKPFKAKTFSGTIAKVGWTGDVEAYEKQSQRGAETYIRQLPKEGYQPSNATQRSYQKSEPKSNVTMFVSYAKDLVVALQQTEGFTQDKFDTLLKAVIEGGRTLSQADYESKPASNEVRYEPLDDVVDPDNVGDIKQSLGEIGWLKDENPADDNPLMKM